METRSKKKGGRAVQVAALRNLPDEQPVAGPSGANGTSLRHGTISRREKDDEKITGTPVTGRNSDHNGETQSELPDINTQVLNNPEGKRVPWSKEELVEVMRCYHYCRLKGNKDYKVIYKHWRERNPATRLNIDANKLQNQRRYIEQHRKLSTQEIDNIITSIQQEQSITNQNSQHRPNEIQIEETTSTPDIGDPILRETETSILQTEIEQKYWEIREKNKKERERLPKINTNRKARHLIKEGNESIKQLAEHRIRVTDLETINSLIYAAAVIITHKLIKTNHKKTPENRPKIVPRWQKRLINKITTLRKDLSNLTHIQTGKLKTDKAISKNLTEKYDLGKNKSLAEAIEEVKQKVSATAQRLRRYKNRQLQYLQNRMFETNPKRFYREMRDSQIEVVDHPTREDLDEYWREIYESDIQHNQNADWLKKQKNENKKKMNWDRITTKDIKEAIDSSQNWKTPGIDKIPNFWWKQFYASHELLADAFNDVIDTRSEIPNWLAEGETVLLPKSQDTKNPKNYRPITCLNTVYKLLTKVIANRITYFANENTLIPTEQKGCSRNTLGCKDQLLMSKALLEDCKKNKKNLCLGWIDYKKAFDSVPHSWLLQSMKLFGISSRIVELCRNLMPTWRTTLTLNTSNGTVQTDPMRITRGIYQGDSLSPLLFVIAMTPLTKLLNKNLLGYRIEGTEKPISHLIYMDDLKLISPSQAKMKTMVSIVKQFSDDIHMSFGIDKCAMATFRKGELYLTENLKLDNAESIKALENGDTYKYLGIKEGTVIDHKALKEEVLKEYKTRVRKILQTHLTSRNKLLAIGTLAVPTIEYSFGVIDWTLAEIRNLDRKTRKLLTTYGMLHPRADTDRLYVSRENGGRGLRQLELAYNNTIYSVGQYIQKKALSDYVVQAVMVHENKKPAKQSLIKRSNKIGSDLKIEGSDNNEPLKKEIVKNRLKQKIETAWKNKIMHGQLPRQMNVLPIDKKLSYGWLKYGKLKGETESLLVAAQDQAIKTRYIEQRIHGTRQQGLCRICKRYDETIEHIYSACPILAEREYIERHNKLCTIIHFELSKHYKCPLKSTNWYEHHPERVTTSEDGETTIMYDYPIRTDLSTPALKPDIVIKEKNTCYLIDVAVPSDRNIVTKEAEKNLKYKTLQIDIQRMWHRKTKIIPVIIGATGYVGNNIIENLKLIPGNHNFQRLQLAAVMGTAHIIRKVLT